MHLSILAKRTLKPYQTVFPLTAFAPQLREREVTARNFHTLDRTKMFECDVLMICEGDFRNFLPPAQRTREAEIELVERLRSRVPKIVWFDEADSSGRLRTYILPHVDIYLKAHLFRDKMDYKRPMITGDPHRDFPSWRGITCQMMLTAGREHPPMRSSPRYGWAGTSDWEIGHPLLLVLGDIDGRSAWRPESIGHVRRVRQSGNERYRFLIELGIQHEARRSPSTGSSWRSSSRMPFGRDF